MTATTQSFSDVLKRYMPNELFMTDMKRFNWFWEKVDKKQGWKGGSLEVPIETQEAASYSFGALPATTSVNQHAYQMGTLSRKELWGTMMFNEKDLDAHDGSMEQSYLKIAPQKIEQFIRRMSDRVSLQLLGDGSIAKLTADGDASGNLSVDKP